MVPYKKRVQAYVSKSLDTLFRTLDFVKGVLRVIGRIDIQDFRNVSDATPADDDILVWDQATGLWTPEPQGGGTPILQDVLIAGNATGTNWIEANDGFGIKNTGTNDVRVQLNSTTGLLRLENNSPSGDASGLDITPATVSITTVNSFTVNGGSGGPFEGIKYAADYSSLYTNRSLVDKEYADGIISSSSNSLYQTLLNGNQTGPNWIDVENLFGLRLSDFYALKQVQLRVGDIKLFIDDSTFQSTVLIEPAQITLDSGNQFLLRAQDLAEIEGYGTNFPGLTYIADHSAHYTPRSLVDKAYVDSVAGGGIFGISDATGTYTYYATLTLAMAAAVSGDTIEMFADVEETTNTTITLIDEITINGNGHTYTLNVDDTASAFTFTIASGTVYLNNIKVVRTGRALGTTSGYVLSTNTTSNIKCQGAIFENDYGRGVQAGGSNLYGAHIISYLDGIYAPFSSANLYDCYIEVTGTGKGTYLSTGIISNCHVKSSSGDAINNGSGRIYNSVGISTGAFGIVCNGEVYNSTGQSTSGVGISAQRMTNCVGISSTNTGISGEGRNCTGISTSGVGGSGKFYNSTLISSSNYGASGNGGKLIGSTARSTSSIPVLCGTDYEISNSHIICDWNNVGGHCTTSTVLLTATLTNNKFKVTNNSAYCISAYGGGGGSTWKWTNNSFEGSTTPVNTTNVTQGITNTSDSQGNILI